MVLVRTYDAKFASRTALSHLPSLLRFPALVWTNRYMVQNFLRRDLLSRVHGSVLGVYWLLLQPMFLFAIYFVVFGIFLGNPKVGTGADASFAIYLFSGVIVFHALVEATSMGCSIITDNGNLVQKVAFPSEVLLVHPSIAALVIYLVGAVVLLVAGLLTGVAQPGWLLCAMPLVLVVQFSLSLGLGMLLASTNVFLRDTTQVWRLITMAWMFFSPVFLRVADLRDKLGETATYWFEVLNPAWALIQAHRLVLGGDDPSLGSFWPSIGIAAAWAVAFLVLGYSLFMSRKHKFSDLI